MFVYAISNSYIDRFDPYWYCRLTGLKLAYVAVILFFVNGFFKSPTFPVLYMLVTAAAVAVTETPSINSPKKKIIAYIGVVILCITTNSIFGLVSFFKWGLLIGVATWSLILYGLLAKNAKTANLIGVLLLIGVVSLAGDVATDLNGVLNHSFFYLEFACVGLAAILLFPNFHDNIVKSAALRLLESDMALFDNALSQTEFDVQILEALLVIENEAEQAPKPVYELLPLLKTLQVLLRGISVRHPPNDKIIIEILLVCHTSIRLSKPISLDLVQLQYLQTMSPKLEYALVQFTKAWNAQCKI
jgi:hypothetical protein